MVLRVTVHPVPQADRAPLDLPAIEQQYGLPAGILSATSQVESGGNPNAVSPAGAQGQFQIMPAVARNLGVDATDPSQAAHGAAKLWADNLKASGGDVERAAMMYHGGPNTAIWGPKTRAYPGKIMAAMEGNAPLSADNPFAQGGAPAPSAPQQDTAPDQFSADNPFAAPQQTPRPVVATPAPVAAAPQAPPSAPAAPMSGIGRFATGAGKGLMDAIDGPAQLIEHGITAGGKLFGFQNAGPAMSHAVGLPSADEAVTSRAKAYAAALGGNDPGVAGSIGEFAGNVVPGVVGGALTGGASAPVTLANLVRGGAVAGATQPIVDTADYWSKALKNTLSGAAGGAIGGKLLHGAAGVINPKVSAMVKILQDHGVPLTVGQIAGTGGAIGRGIRTVEDAARSVPFLGNMVAGAQRRSLEGFNRAGVNRALKEIGDQLPPNIATGNDAVGYAQRKIGAAYDAITPQLATRADSPFQRAVWDIVGMARAPSAMSPDMAKRLEGVVRDDVLRRFSQSGHISGEAFRELESKLGSTAKSFVSSGDPDQRQYGKAVAQLQEELRSLAERSNPTLAAELRKIHAGFRNLATVENAASRGSEGVFSPAQLAQAVRAADTSARKRATAAGTANMQDLSNAGRAVLPSTVPDSGTATRGMVGAAMATVGSTNPATAIPMAAATGAAAGLYSKRGQALAEALMTKRPKGSKALADAIRTAVPVAVGVGARGAVGYAQ